MTAPEPSCGSEFIAGLARLVEESDVGFAYLESGLRRKGPSADRLKSATREVRSRLSAYVAALERMACVIAEDERPDLSADSGQ